MHKLERWAHLTVTGLVQICIVENDKRTIATKFEGDLLQTLGTMFCNQLSYPSLYSFSSHKRAQKRGWGAEALPIQ